MLAWHAAKQLKVGEYSAEKSFLGSLSIESDYRYVGYVMSEKCMVTVTNTLWAGIGQFQLY